MISSHDVMPVSPARMSVGSVCTNFSSISVLHTINVQFVCARFYVSLSMQHVVVAHFVVISVGCRVLSLDVLHVDLSREAKVSTRGPFWPCDLPHHSCARKAQGCMRR